MEHIDRCLPSKQLRRFFEEVGAPSDAAVAEFVETSMNGCTEIVAAQAQVREWARQAYNKRVTQERNANAQGGKRPKARKEKRRQEQGPQDTRRITVGGIEYPRADAGPKPDKCKQKNP